MSRTHIATLWVRCSHCLRGEMVYTVDLKSTAIGVRVRVPPKAQCLNRLLEEEQRYKSRVGLPTRRVRLPPDRNQEAIMTIMRGLAHPCVMMITCRHNTRCFHSPIGRGSRFRIYSVRVRVSLGARCPNSLYSVMPAIGNVQPLWYLVIITQREE